MSIAKTTRVYQMWKAFCRLAIPADAPPDQFREMRRAFMGGAAAMLALVTELGGDEVSEARVIEILEEMREELAEFGQRIGRGEA